MKIILPQRAGRQLSPGAPPHRPNERGFVAVLVMMTLLTLVLAFVASNAYVLSELKQELRLIEHRQLQRLGSRPPPKASTLLSPTNQTSPGKGAPGGSPVNEGQTNQSQI